MINNNINDELKDTIEESISINKDIIKNLKNKKPLFKSSEVQFLDVKGHIKLSSIERGDILIFDNGAKGVIIYTDQRCFGEDAKIPIINLTNDVPENTSFEIIKIRINMKPPIKS